MAGTRNGSMKHPNPEELLQGYCKYDYQCNQSEGLAESGLAVAEGNNNDPT
ncbi:MAG: hypothetical protein IPP37_20375 [Saprospiraceae bacterium]|nr:hypothetical protein [Saprospiraceae bacterium]